jgi:molybdenum cofactor synthesis domain-containing protein
MSTSLSAQGSGWPPAPGRLAIPVWPGIAPGAPANSPAEADLTTAKGNRIAGRLVDLSQQDAALILTVGGTGLGPRDRTPEATRRVIDREAPGLAEAMRFSGAGRNPFARLSRAVAGLKGSTLIVNLPGSKRGAEESLSSIVDLIHHGLDVAAGGKAHP